MSNIRFSVINPVSLTGWCSQPSLPGKTFNVGHNVQTFSPEFFYIGMLIGTIYRDHFTSLSEALTLAEVTRSV